MKKLARNLEGMPGVSMPQAYSQLSSSKVLTMAFIAGVKINNVAAIDAAGLARADYWRGKRKPPGIWQPGTMAVYFTASPLPVA